MVARPPGWWGASPAGSGRIAVRRGRSLKEVDVTAAKKAARSTPTKAAPAGRRPAPKKPARAPKKPATTPRAGANRAAPARKAAAAAKKVVRAKKSAPPTKPAPAK